MSASLRRGLAASALVVGVLFSGAACSTQPAVIESYNPSMGIGAQQGGMKLTNVVIVSDGSTAYLSGGLNAADGDKLTGATATQLQADGSDGASLGITGSTVDIPRGRLVQLDQTGLGVTGQAVPGLTARVLFNFEKAGVVAMTVPVLSAKNPDYATVTPKPAASAGGSASATPSQSPTPSASASS